MQTKTVLQAPALKCDDGVKISARGKLERRIIWGLIEHLAALGFIVRGVDDGEEYQKCATGESAMEVIFSVDDSRLCVRKEGAKTHRILIVLGNGIDCISDWNYTEGDPDSFNVAMDAFDPEQFE